LKSAEKLKNRDLELQFQGLLHGLIEGVPFLKIESLKSDSPISQEWEEGSGSILIRADFLVKVQAERGWTLVVGVLRVGQPREVRTGALQVKHLLSLLPSETRGYGVLLAPFISKESACLCAEAGVGYADLAGNARLSFDQVFIEIRVAENPFREQRLVKSIFTPKAARVLRVLLQGPLRAWKVKELADVAQVSFGHVSAVRKHLLANEWAVEESAGLRVNKPDKILSAWAAADRFEDRTTIREYSLLVSDPAELAQQVHVFLGTKRHAFTQWFAAELRHPYTTAPLTTVYVNEFPDETSLTETLLARRVDSGGRLRLILPKDEGVLNPLQTVRGLPLVSDVQLYLDLCQAGLRGTEAAEELRKWPDFSGGWK
jgi:hypothetical protein